LDHDQKIKLFCMKKYAVIIVLIALTGLNVKLSGQNPGLCRYPERMASFLNLTEDQQASMKSIQEEFLASRDSILSDGEISPQGRRDRMKTLHERRDQRVSEVLTAEQLEKFRQAPPENRSRMQQGPGFNEEVHALLVEKRRAFDRLLTDEEKEIIRHLRDEMRACRRGPGNHFRGYNPAFREERAEKRDLMREKLRALDPVIENHRDELDAIKEETGRVIGERDSIRGPYCPKPDGERFRNNDGRMERRFLLLDPEHSRDCDPHDPDGTMRVKLYPNPAKNTLNIEFDASTVENTRIELLDKNGNVLDSFGWTVVNPGFQSTSIDVSKLGSGDLYYIRISQNGERYIEKFVKP
jgi:hypothetical protein